MSSWRDMAMAEASCQNCDFSIVLATIFSETGGRNTWGDNHRSFGYGQVQPKYHYYAYLYAGQRLGISVPAQSDLAAIETLTLGNNQFSMIVAVKTISTVWESVNKNFIAFTKRYVGAGVSPSTITKRQADFNYYCGITNNAPYDITSMQANFDYVSADGPNTSDDNTQSIGATNLMMKLGSLITGNALYGRKYRILVRNNNDVAFDVSDLRCTFSVHKTFQIQCNYSEVNIYNLDPNKENTIIKEGNRLVIQAGYEGERYGTIYDGQVIQVLRTKENGTDFKLTLIALDGDYFFTYGITWGTYTRAQTLMTIAKQITTTASNPIETGNIEESLNNTKLIRGKTVFGMASKYLRQIAQTTNTTFHVLDNKANIESLNSWADFKSAENKVDIVFELSPDSGLIGCPVQEDYGMRAKMLLNPGITLSSFVHIDNSLIQAMQQEQGQPYRTLDQDGIYRIIEITHSGDTKGDDWYTEILTITQAGYTPAMLTNPNQNPY